MSKNFLAFFAAHCQCDGGIHCSTHQGGSFHHAGQLVALPQTGKGETICQRGSQSFDPGLFQVKALHACDKAAAAAAGANWDVTATGVGRSMERGNTSMKQITTLKGNKTENN